MLHQMCHGAPDTRAKNLILWPTEQDMQLYICTWYMDMVEQALGWLPQHVRDTNSQTVEFGGCRQWIWIGVGYLWFFWFVLTTLTVVALKYLDPEKARPSIDDGASAAEQLTVQQRVMKAVSLRNIAQSKGAAATCEEKDASIFRA